MKRSTTRLERVFLILMAASYVLQSGNLFLDRALLYVDQQQQQQQHQFTSTSKATKQQSSSISSSSKPLTWFLHFHKAAGSSFTDLALKNREVFRDAEDKHGHLELSHQGAFRWEFLGSEESSKLNRTTCWLDQSEGRNKMEQSQASVLGREMKSLREQGVSFVSTEHWFPSQKVLKEQQEAAPIMVALFRDPVERVLSSFAFHNRGGGRCSDIAPGTADKRKKKRCDLDDWHKGEANMYVSMLNGIPFGPRKVGTECAPHMLDINAQDYQRAEQSLDQNFQVVLTLDSVRQQPLQVACVLNKALGWNETTLPQKNRNNKERAVVDSTGPQVLQQVKDTNAYDIQLYQHAQELENRLFAELGCNAEDEVVKSER